MDPIDTTPTAVIAAPELPVAPRRAANPLVRAIATVALAFGLLAIGGVAAVSAASPDPSPGASAPAGGTGATGGSGTYGGSGGSNANCPNM
jgi:hypothetical protein